MVAHLMTIVLAYLVGSIPSGYLLVKYVFTEGEDVRAYGSGATGATNVTRVAGLKGGALTYLCDAGKGVLAVGLSGWINHHDLWWMGVAGILAILGHVFPVWIGFRGGKGVATGVGSFVLLSPWAILSALVVWGVAVYWKRYVALGSILAAAAVPPLVILWEGYIFSRPAEQVAALVTVTLIGCGVVIAAHHENIKRLLRGIEDRIGESPGGAKGNRR